MNGSTTNSAIGTALNVSVDGGGFCFFPSVSPYLYGNLVLFIPRAGTFAIIILIYARLFIFFRQQATSHHKQESNIHEASFHLPLPTPASDLQHNHLAMTSFDEPSSGRSSDGVADHRLSGLTKMPSTLQEDQTTAMLQFKLAHYKFSRAMSRRDSQESGTTLASGRHQGWLGRARRHKSITGQEQSDVATTPAIMESIEGGSEPIKRSSAKLQDSAEILNSPQGFEEQLVLLGQQTFSMQLPLSKTPLHTPPGESASLLSGSTRVTPTMEKDEKALAGHTIPAGSPLRGIVSMNDATSPGSDSLLTLASPGPRAGFPGLEAPDGQEVQKASPVMGLWEALASVDPVDSDDAGLAEACAEKGRRLSASEENRRVSYLMLLYPMAVSFN